MAIFIAKLRDPSAPAHMEEDAIVEGNNREEVLQRALKSCTRGSHVDRILDELSRVPVWEEGFSWTAYADDYLPS